MKFTESTAETIAAPPPGPVKNGKPTVGECYEWDDDFPSFGLRVYSSGRRVWIARYRGPDGRQRKLTLGDARKVSLRDARKAAKQAFAAVVKGEDPASEKAKARKRLRVIDLFDAYLEKKGPELAPAWRAAVTRHLKAQAAPLHHEIAETLHRGEIVRLLDAVKKDAGAVASNRLRSTLSAAWTWGMRSGLLDAATNPVNYTPLVGGAEKARERVLSDDELALIWRCTAGGGAHDRIIRLLMLTGARRSEIAGGTWDEIVVDADGQAGMWTLPGTRTKNGLPHEIPLVPLALAQLPDRREGGAALFPNRPRDQSKPDAERSFSGWSASKLRLDARMLKAMKGDFEAAHGRSAGANEVRLEPWCLHDLRRSFASRCNDLGTEPHVVESLLNHVSGASKRGIAGVYNRSTYRTQKRAAMLSWEMHIRKLVGLEAPASNVVPLARQA